jgi:hypothetical protein
MKQYFTIVNFGKWEENPHNQRNSKHLIRDRKKNKLSIQRKKPKTKKHT